MNEIFVFIFMNEGIINFGMFFFMILGFVKIEILKEEELVFIVEELVEFLGGMVVLKRYLVENLVYL